MSLERFGIRWNGSHEPMATPMDDGYWTPWHIAEAEIAALRERCERLAKLVETKRAPTLARDGEEKFGAWLRAALDCATNNDLAPAAGEAQEKTDG